MLDAWIPPPQQGSNKTGFDWWPCRTGSVQAAEADTTGSGLREKRASKIKRTWHQRQESGDPSDPTTKEREDHSATHTPFRSWCPLCVKRKEKKSRTEMEEEKRGVVRPQFDSITKLLAKRTHKEDLTKMILDIFASEREHQTRG